MLCSPNAVPFWMLFTSWMLYPSQNVIIPSWMLWPLLECCSPFEGFASLLNAAPLLNVANLLNVVHSSWILFLNAIILNTIFPSWMLCNSPEYYVPLLNVVLLSWMLFPSWMLCTHPGCCVPSWMLCSFIGCCSPPACCAPLLNAMHSS